MLTRSKLIAPLLIIGAVVLAYANSFDGAFLLDDGGWLKKNAQEPALSSHITNSTRPLVGLSFFLNYRLSGKNAADYHAFNLLIHLSACLLLYGIVRRTLTLARSSAIYSCLVPPFAAVIWGVHPIQTESVTYIVQRAESLMGLFYLLTLYSTIRGITVRRSLPWFAAAALACMFGMLTKPVMVTAPVVVLLYDRTFVAGSFSKALRCRRGLYACLSATWLILAWLVLSPNESTTSTGLAVQSVTPMSYLAVQQGVVLHYLRLIAWPHPLCLDYAWPPVTQAIEVILPALILVPLVLSCIYLVVRRSPIGFCMAWFFIILAPSSSILPISDLAVEHRLYLPLAGLAVLAASSVVFLTELGMRWAHSRRLTAWIATAILSSVTMALMLTTHMRNRVYSSYEAFSRSIVRARPYNFRARTMLIEAITANQDFAQAEREASSLISDLLGAIDSGHRKYSVSASRPDRILPTAYSQQGMARLHLDRTEEALQDFETALAYRSDYFTAQYLLAVALMGLERYQEALPAAQRAIEIDPESSSARTLLGIILIKAGREHEAISPLEKAVTISPRETIARLELAWLLATDPSPLIRDGDRALELCRDVIRLSGGGNYRALDATAAAFASSGNFAAAVDAAKKALLDMRTRIEAGENLDNNRGCVPSTLDKIQERLDQYQSGKPWFRPVESALPTRTESPDQRIR